MENSARQNVLREYTRRFSTLPFLGLTLFGYLRFDVKDGEIVQKSTRTQFLTVILIICTHASIFYVLYILVIDTPVLISAEIIIVLQFSLFHNLFLVNIAFVNRGVGAEVINKSIDLDVIMGVDQTKSIRDGHFRIYSKLCSVFLALEVFIGIVLGCTYSQAAPGSILFPCIYYFVSVFTVYYDMTYFMMLVSMLAMRVRYINVAIMKAADLAMDIVAEDSFLHLCYWKKDFDEQVNLHKRAKPETYVKIFQMIFQELLLLKRGYRFTILFFMASVPFGTCLAVQSLINYIKGIYLSRLRVLFIILWAIMRLSYTLLIAMHVDLLHAQIRRTKIICSHILLKPSNTDEVIELSESTLNTVETRESKISIYEMYFLDSGTVIKIVATILMYITAQLQLSFPKIEENSHINDNETVLYNKI